MGTTSDDVNARSYSTTIVTATSTESSVVYSSCVARETPTPIFNGNVSNHEPDHFSELKDEPKKLFISTTKQTEFFDDYVELVQNCPDRFQILGFDSAVLQWNKITATSVTNLRFNLAVIWLKQDNFCLSIDQMQDELSLDDIREFSLAALDKRSITRSYDSGEIHINTAEPIQAADPTSTEEFLTYSDLGVLGDLVSETVSRSEIRNKFAFLLDNNDTSYITHSEFYHLTFDEVEESFEALEQKTLNQIDDDEKMDFLGSSECDNLCSSYTPIAAIEPSIEPFEFESVSLMKYNHYNELDKFEIPHPSNHQKSLENYTNAIKTVPQTQCETFDEYYKDHAGLVRPIYPFKLGKMESYYQWFIKDNGSDCLHNLAPLACNFATFVQTVAQLDAKKVKMEHVQVYNGHFSTMEQLHQKSDSLNLKISDADNFSTPLPGQSKMDRIPDSERLGANITEESSSFFTNPNNQQTEEASTSLEKFTNNIAEEQDQKRKIALENELKDECLIEMLDVQSWNKTATSNNPQNQSCSQTENETTVFQNVGFTNHQLFGSLKRHASGSKEKRGTNSFKLNPASKGDVDRSALLTANLESSFSSLMAQQDFSSVTLDISTDRTINELQRSTIEQSSQINLSLPRGLSANLRVPQIHAKMLKNMKPGDPSTYGKSKNKYVTRWLAKNEREFIRLNCLKIHAEDLSTTRDQSSSFEKRQEQLNLRRLSFQNSIQSHDSRRDPNKKTKTLRSDKKRSNSLQIPELGQMISSSKNRRRATFDRPSIEQESVIACLDSLKNRLKSKYEQEYLGKLCDQILLENICQFRERTLSAAQLSKVLTRYDSSFGDLNIKGKQEVVNYLLEDLSVRIDSKTLLKRLIKQPKVSSYSTKKQH